MTLFLKTILGCLGILALMSGAAIFVGRVQPANPLLPELHMCEDQMCVFGIMPDKIQFGDAVAALRKNSAFSFSVAGNTSQYKQTSPIYRLDLMRSDPGNSAYSDTDIVYEVDLVFYDENSVVTADQIIAIYGAPCGIAANGLPATSVLLYPGMMVYLGRDSNSLLAY